MYRFITILLALFITSPLFSQLKYGIKAGVNQGIYYDYQNLRKKRVIQEFGVGFNIGVSVAYDKGKHRLELQPGINTIISPWMPGYTILSPNEKETFVFLEFPLVYSYEVFKRFRMGAGINNSILYSASYKLSNEFGEKPYLFGLIGEAGYSLTSNLEVAGVYRYVGLFQNDVAYRTYPSYTFELRWRF